MSIEAEDINSWIGSDAVDQAGEKLGTVSDVFFHGGEPVIAELVTGRVVHKHQLVSLSGSSVAPNYLRLGPFQPVPSEGGGVMEQDLSSLTEQDPALSSVPVTDLEGLNARQQRLAAAAASDSRAAELEAEAQRHLKAEQEAAGRADAAKRDEAEAHDARLELEEAARRARAEADAQR